MQPLDAYQVKEQQENQSYYSTILSIIRRRGWIVPITVIIVLLLALYFTRSPELYRATALVKTATPSYGGYGYDRDFAFSSVLRSTYGTLSTEVEIIKGRELAERVVEKLRIAKKAETPELVWRSKVTRLQGQIEIRRRDFTKLLQITARSDTAEDAKNIANAVSREYIEMHKASRQRMWKDLIDQLESELKTVSEDLEQSRQKLYDYAMEEGIANAFAGLLGNSGRYVIEPSLSENLFNLKSKVVELELELEVLKKNFPAADPQVRSLENQLSVYRERLDQANREAQSKYNKQLELTSIASEVTFKQQLYSFLMSRQQELRAQYTMQIQSPEIVEEALLPLYPSTPDRRPTIAMSLFVGLFMGIGLAIFLEYVDNSIRTTKDVVKSADLPVLGIIPKLKGKNKHKNGTLVTYNGNNPDISWSREIYKKSFRVFELKTMAMINGATDKNTGLTLLVTGSTPQEGASVVAANLAISIAQTGKKVLLVDADCFHPSQNKLLESDNEIGLTDYITDKAGWNEIINKSFLNDNLYIVTCGSQGNQADPSVIIGSVKMDEFINKARESFDTVIFDSPPVSVSSESAAIGLKVDGAVLVVKANSTKKDSLLQSKEIIQNSGGNIIGVALNFATNGKNIQKYYRRSYLRKSSISKEK
jgi:capsular exopolysaccharide synthesis family protein